MRLRNIMLSRRIAGGTLFRTECALAGNAAVQLFANFFTSALLERISATAGKNSQTEREQDRQRFHPLMIESGRRDASVTS
jgi:hypothetical protein